MFTNQTERINFASTKNIPAYPDFLDIQIKSFQDFFQLETKSDERGNEGLYNTFMESCTVQIQSMKILRPSFKTCIWEPSLI